MKKKKEKKEDDDITFVESTEDGVELPKKNQLKKVREDLKTCRAEKEEYLTGWQRAKADYVNLQKELDQVRLNSSVLAKEKMLENLLPAIDSFEMAFSNEEAWQKIDETWRKGVEYIYQQLITGLENTGIQKIDKVEISFDPNIHQSVETVKTNDKKKDHLVAKINQAGYKIGNSLSFSGQVRIVRPAKVVIYQYKK